MKLSGKSLGKRYKRLIYAFWYFPIYVMYICQKYDTCKAILWQLSNPVSWENLLRYMFSCLFTWHKVAKGQIFPTVLQKDKSNPVYFSKRSSQVTRWDFPISVNWSLNGTSWYNNVAHMFVFACTIRTWN